MKSGTSIAGGTLYKKDGTTVISDGDFITFAEGNLGLKFTPDTDRNAAATFDVESSQNGTSVAAQSGVATSTITITPVGDTPQVADITTLEETLSGAIVLNRGEASEPFLGTCQFAGRETNDVTIVGTANGGAILTGRTRGTKSLSSRWHDPAPSRSRHDGFGPGFPAGPVPRCSHTGR